MTRTTAEAICSLWAWKTKFENTLQVQHTNILQLAGDPALERECATLGASIHLLQTNAYLLEANLAEMAASHQVTTTGRPVLEQLVAVVTGPQL